MISTCDCVDRDLQITSISAFCDVREEQVTEKEQRNKPDATEVSVWGALYRGCSWYDDLRVLEDFVEQSLDSRICQGSNTKQFYIDVLWQLGIPSLGIRGP